MNDFEVTLKNHEERIAKLEALFAQPTPLQVKQMAINEFLRGMILDSDVERSLAVAYFLEKFEKMPAFNIDDIKNGYRRAKEPLPKNLNDAIYRNIKKGFAM